MFGKGALGWVTPTVAQKIVDQEINYVGRRKKYKNSPLVKTKKEKVFCKYDKIEIHGDLVEFFWEGLKVGELKMAYLVEPIREESIIITGLYGFIQVGNQVAQI